VLRLYDEKTRSVEEITTARAGVVRVSCAGDLRSLVVGDLIRRIADHHRLRAIGIWPDVPGAAALNVRPAELTSGEADVHVGETVGRCSLASGDDLDPLAVRLALLTRHYRADADLSREDLEEADSSLARWRRQVAGWAESPGRPLNREYVAEAVTALDVDLDTPSVFPVLSRLADDTSVPPGAKFETVIKLDMILGLDLVALVGRL
jgi:cysteinyl-tRNA synthetase